MTLTVTDLFAGAGGSSTGLIQVPGLRIEHASNHWRLAIEVHNTNHPDTDHSSVDLHQEDPRFFPRTDILWASPECTKWSQASGIQRPPIEEGLFEDPMSDDAAQRSRLLMFDVLRFAEHHRYEAMIIENVVDIAVQAQYTMAWYEWRRQLGILGYRHRVVSLNSMHAQAYGLPAPQSRDRIYIVCWREGNRAPDLDRILRPQAYCPKCDAMIAATQSWKNGRTVGRYRQAYLYTHTVCGTVVDPVWLPAVAAIDWSVPGERIGDRLRALKPKTIDRVVNGIARWWSPAALAALAVPVEGRDGKNATPLDHPMRTQTTRLETALVHTPFVTELYGTSTTRSVLEPAGAFTAQGNHHFLAQHPDALAMPYYGSSQYAKPVSEPIGTLTTVDRYALIHRHNTGGAEMTTPALEPMRTLTTAGHQSVLRRPGDVSVEDLAAAREMVDDVYFRMFMPREVAAGMAFPDDYRWDVRDERGRTPSNRDLVKMAGNAVTPPSSRDLGHAVVESLAA